MDNSNFKENSNGLMPFNNRFKKIISNRIKNIKLEYDMVVYSIKEGKSFGLSYDPGIDTAAHIDCYYEGYDSNKFLHRALKDGIWIFHHEKLTADLFRFIKNKQIPEDIPPDLYETVAELLSMVYKS